MTVGDYIGHFVALFFLVTIVILIKYFVSIKMFKSLVSTVSEQCQQIKQGMALFPYFNTWDENVVAECCRVSSPAEIPSNEIILGPGVGDPHTVYFIMEGICRIVEHLHVRVTINRYGKQIQKLCKSDESITSEETKHKRYLSRLFNRKDSPQAEEKGILEGDDTIPSSNPDSKMAEGEEEKSDDLDNPLEDVKTVPDFEPNTEKTENAKQSVASEKETQTTTQSEDSKQFKTDCPPVEDKIALSESTKEVIIETDRHLKILEECQKRRAEAICILKSETVKDKPKNVKSIFIESGILLTGACFGLGKLGKDNFIMSCTRVKILKIPLRFLLRHNPCNIWNRIALFHNLYLFEDKKTFQYFQNERKWTARKKNQTDDLISMKNIPNYTSTGDVPYWIRLTNTR